jgi:hypothetical protein
MPTQTMMDVAVLMPLSCGDCHSPRHGYCESSRYRLVIELTGCGVAKVIVQCELLRQGEQLQFSAHWFRDLVPLLLIRELVENSACICFWTYAELEFFAQLSQYCTVLRSVYPLLTPCTYLLRDICKKNTCTYGQFKVSFTVIVTEETRYMLLSRH